MAVNDVELTYDEVGNVLTYGDKEFTWNTGRNLESIVDGDNNYSYTYDENGIRTSKTVNGVTTYYNSRNGVIISQSDGTNTMYFQYDMNGLPIGFIFNGTQYFYLTNQMGDVIAITESNGNIIAQYVYDEWGKLLNVYIVNEDNTEQIEAANANPLRYRGYYYDNETGYYYLQSRYYDASICRFINADIFEIASITKNIVAGTNLFSYCNNNPINYIDPNGTFRISVGWATVLLNAVILAISVICTYFAKVKSLKFLAKISSKFKKIFKQTVKKISQWISKNLARIIKKCFKVTIATYRINKAANQISWFINLLIDLSPGAIIANLLDRVDRDGKSGTIYW